MKVKKKKTFMILCMAVLGVACTVILAISAASESSKEYTYTANPNPNTEPETEPSSVTAERRNFLLLGTDRVSGLTDVMMLVSIDVEKRSADIVQIPRDTYARYGEGSYRKLNGALSALGGGQGVCDFLSEAMCIDIEGYVLFDLDVFVKVVDAVGGVEIDIPFDIDYDDPYQNLSIHLDAGRQTLDGAAAEQFVRYRSGYVRGDIGRIDAQKLFVSALIKKVSDSMSFSVLLKSAFALIGDVNTNLSVADIPELASIMRSIAPSRVTMLTLSGSDIRSRSGAWYYVISKSSAEQIAMEHLGADTSERKFDADGVFLNPSDSEFAKIYDSYIPYFPMNASDIAENGIEIQKQ